MREYTNQCRIQLEEHIDFLRRTHNKHIGIEVRRFLEGVCKDVIKENDGVVPPRSSLSSLIEVLLQLSKSGKGEVINLHFVNSLRSIMHPLNQSAHHTITFKPSGMDVENILTSERDVFLNLYGQDFIWRIIAFVLLMMLSFYFTSAFIDRLTRAPQALNRPAPPPAVRSDDKIGLYYADGNISIQSLRKRPPEHIKEAIKAYTRYRVAYLYRREDEMRRELMPNIKCFYNKRDYPADDFIKRRFKNKLPNLSPEKPRVIILKTQAGYWSDDWVYLSAVEEDDVPFMQGQIVIFQKLNGEWKFAAEFFPKERNQSRCAPEVKEGRLIW